jgi:hypothetical protein
MEKLKNEAKRTSCKRHLVLPEQRLYPQSFFVKQPVAGASIDGDPLTPHVLVNGGQVRQAAELAG